MPRTSEGIVLYKMDVGHGRVASQMIAAILKIVAAAALLAGKVARQGAGLVWRGHQWRRVFRLLQPVSRHDRFVLDDLCISQKNEEF